MYLQLYTSTSELWEGHVEQVQLGQPVSLGANCRLTEVDALRIKQVNGSGFMHPSEAWQLQLKGFCVERARYMVPGSGNRMINELA